MGIENKNIVPSKFRFWCQKILPLVYDDSLSYYELLCKVVKKLDEVIDGLKILDDDFDTVYNGYIQLKTFVETYFQNLDVTVEINNKLDQMVEDGTFDTIINENIFNRLNEKIGYIENDLVSANNNILTLQQGVENLNSSINNVNDSVNNQYGKIYNNEAEINLLKEGAEMHNIKLNRYGSAIYLISYTPEYAIDRVKEIHTLFDGGWNTNPNYPFANTNDPMPSADSDGKVVVDYLQSIGVVHLDYWFITHYHHDHIGVFGYLIERGLIDSTTKVVIPANVDWSQMPSGLEYIAGYEEALKNRLSEIGCEILDPANSGLIELGSAYVKCYNRESLFTNYYGRQDEYSDISDFYNAFSSVYEINSGKFVFTYTGDVTKIAQDQLKWYLKKCTCLVTPHHSFDYEGDEEFFNVLMPEIAITFNAKNREVDTYNSMAYYFYNNNKIPYYYTCNGSNATIVKCNKNWEVVYGKPNMFVDIVPTCLIELDVENQYIAKDKFGIGLNDNNAVGIRFKSIKSSNYMYGKQPFISPTANFPVVQEDGLYLLDVGLRVCAQENNNVASEPNNLNTVFCGISYYGTQGYRPYNKACRSQCIGRNYVKFSEVVYLKKGDVIAPRIECDAVYVSNGVMGETQTQATTISTFTPASNPRYNITKTNTYLQITKLR